MQNILVTSERPSEIFSSTVLSVHLKFFYLDKRMPLVSLTRYYNTRSSGDFWLRPDDYLHRRTPFRKRERKGWGEGAVGWVVRTALLPHNECIIGTRWNCGHISDAFYWQRQICYSKQINQFCRTITVAFKQSPSGLRPLKEMREHLQLERLWQRLWKTMQRLYCQPFARCRQVCHLPCFDLVTWQPTGGDVVCIPCQPGE